MFFRVRANLRSGIDPTDLAIVGLVVAGLTNAMIGQMLGYTEQTVKNRLTAIYRAAGVRNRTRLAFVALQRGWVEFAP